jgi:hypothetical protein
VLVSLGSLSLVHLSTIRNASESNRIESNRMQFIVQDCDGKRKPAVARNSQKHRRKIEQFEPLSKLKDC